MTLSLGRTIPTPEEVCNKLDGYQNYYRELYRTYLENKNRLCSCGSKNPLHESGWCPRCESVFDLEFFLVGCANAIDRLTN